MEAIQQTDDGTVGTGASTVSAVSRNGDLVGRMWLDVRLTPAAAAAIELVQLVQLILTCLNTGHAFVNQVEVEIGGQRIDRHDGHRLDAYNELTDHLQDEALGLNKGPPARNTAGGNNTVLSASPLQLYIPLKFWFNKNPGLALPLIALQYHEVKVKLTARGTAFLPVTGILMVLLPQLQQLTYGLITSTLILMKEEDSHKYRTNILLNRSKLKTLSSGSISKS